jgi:hypothetical protein
VPETAIDKNGDSLNWKDKIRFAQYIACVKLPPFDPGPD